MEPMLPFLSDERIRLLRREADEMRRARQARGRPRAHGRRWRSRRHQN